MNKNLVSPQETRITQILFVEGHNPPDVAYLAFLFGNGAMAVEVLKEKSAESAMDLASKAVLLSQEFNEPIVGMAVAANSSDERQRWACASSSNTLDVDYCMLFPFENEGMPDWMRMSVPMNATPMFLELSKAMSDCWIMFRDAGVATLPTIEQAKARLAQ